MDNKQLAKVIEGAFLEGYLTADEDHNDGKRSIEAGINQSWRWKDSTSRKCLMEYLLENPDGTTN